MNTIKIYLAESGRIADLHKDFPLYQGQFQNKLLNVFVPTSLLAPEFTTLSEQGQTLSEYVAGTAVKIGMQYLTRGGELKVSENRYMRYLKTLTYQNVEYALFERKLPKEFTLYAGQRENAPTLIINVVNIETDVDPNELLSVIPSQTCRLDVMPSADLDNDEAIEPSELETINARLTAIDETLAEKQDKIDESINLTTNASEEVTWQDSQTVVGAINNNTAQNELNRVNIADNTSDIAQNTSDIAYLYEHMSQPEEYIGQMTGSSLPTDSQLTAFVVETAGREPKNADVIIFILQVSGGTDKNYKYTYSIDGWNGYEIPALEQADNGSLGLIKGTYNIGSANNTIVDISGGQILNIYVKDETNTYRNVREYLNTNASGLANVINGTTVVAKALSATNDSLGNNIVNTYLTQNAGVTKAQMREYALPRTFNDVSFLTDDGFSSEIPSGASPIYTVTTSAVGDFELFSAEKVITNATFQLSSKNSYTDTIFVSVDYACTVQFRLTTEIYLNDAWETANVELSDEVHFATNGQVKKLTFASTLNSLEEVYTLTDDDKIRQTLEVVTTFSSERVFSVYSNDTYPSTFYLNTTSQTIIVSQGKLGEQPVYELTPDGAITSSGISFVGSDAVEIFNNTECELKISIPKNTTGYSQYFNNDTIINTITLGGNTIYLWTPYNNVFSDKPSLGRTHAIIGDLDEVKTNGSRFPAADTIEYVMKCFIKIIDSNIYFIVDEDYIGDKLDKTSSTYKIYGTTSTGAQTLLGYDTTPTGNIPRRDTSDQIAVPLTPTDNTHASSKKYVDDQVATRVPLLTEESYTIATTDWQALSSSEPYKYSATVTATYIIGNDTEVGTINDQPVLFANYGFVVGAVSGQSVTIYSIDEPDASVTILVGYRG